MREQPLLPEDGPERTQQPLPKTLATILGEHATGTTEDARQVFSFMLVAECQYSHCKRRSRTVHVLSGDTPKVFFACKSHRPGSR